MKNEKGLLMLKRDETRMKNETGSWCISSPECYLLPGNVISGMWKLEWQWFVFSSSYCFQIEDAKPVISDTFIILLFYAYFLVPPCSVDTSVLLRLLL